MSEIMSCFVGMKEKDMIKGGSSYIDKFVNVLMKINRRIYK